MLHVLAEDRKEVLEMGWDNDLFSEQHVQFFKSRCG